jgi:hypothetical protein
MVHSSPPQIIEFSAGPEEERATMEIQRIYRGHRVRKAHANASAAHSEPSGRVEVDVSIAEVEGSAIAPDSLASPTAKPRAHENQEAEGTITPLESSRILEQDSLMEDDEQGDLQQSGMSPSFRSLVRK